MDVNKPVVDESFRVLHKKAHEFITDQHDILKEDFGFGDFDHFTFDSEKRTISFIKNDHQVLKAGYQLLGTIDVNTNTWSWHWNNSTISKEELEELEVIKNYGDFFNYGLLTKAQWPATEADAWAVTAISAYLRGGKGIFKINIGDTFAFIYFNEILSQ